MLKSTLLIAITAAVVLPAHAQRVTKSEIPVSFTLAKSQCSALAADVTGNGELHAIFAATVNPGGVFHLIENRTAHGTAIDTNGRRYVFHDASHYMVSAKAGFVLINNGSFVLEPKGASTHITVHFVAKFVVNANGTITVNSFRAGGDLGCNPM